MGTLIYPSGAEYRGEWKGDKVNGKGLMTYANKDRYEGEFKDG